MDVSAHLADFHFLHPAWLLALLPLLGLAAYKLTRARRQGAWSAVVDADLLPLLALAQGGRMQSPWTLIAMVWTLAVLALAGPAWQREQSRAFKLPAAWVVVLDLSPTMTVTDLTPDRAARARYAINDVLAAARDARVGLVAYAGEPHTVTPLTSDIATVRLLTQPLSPALMPEHGDRMAPALDEAAQLLANAPGSHPQVIVLADGAGDVAEALASARRLRTSGITVNVVGVGTEAQSPVPGRQGDFERDAEGRLALAGLDTAALRDIARQGGGSYVTLAQLPSLTAALGAPEASPLEAGEDAATRLPHWRNEGAWLLPPLLLLAALLARRGWV